MADIIENRQTNTQEVKIPEGVSPEMHQQMQMALTGKMPEEGQQAPVVQTGEEGEAQTQADIVNQDQPFSFDIFKTELGVEKPEQLLEEVKSLRTYKNTPLPIPEIKFEGENVEESKKLFEAIRLGNRTEVYNILREQIMLDNYASAEVTEQNAPEIIKLGMALRYKDLSQSEIDYKFNKQYGIPKEPQGDLEDEEFKEKHDLWKETVLDIKTSMTIDAKLAKPELVSHKKNLVLPTIEQQQSAPDENYANFQKEFDKIQKESEETQQIVKSYSPKEFGIKMNFNDEPNKIQFDFQFEPDGESFTKASEFVMDDSKVMARYRNQDGTLDRKKYFEDQYFILNREAIIMEAMKQAKNATLKSQLADNTNGGMNRQNINPPGERTEFQKQMDAALGPYMPKVAQN